MMASFATRVRFTFVRFAARLQDTHVPRTVELLSRVSNKSTHDLTCMRSQVLVCSPVDVYSIRSDAVISTSLRRPRFACRTAQVLVAAVCHYVAVPPHRHRDGKHW